MRKHLESGATASQALQAATDRAEQAAQHARSLEAKLQQQTSLAEEASKVSLSATTRLACVAKFLVTSRGSGQSMGCGGCCMVCTVL